MKSPTHLVALLCIIGVASPLSALADDDKPSAGHEAFIKGLREMDKTKLVAEVKVESASKPRSLSPVVSRFKGWFIDVTEKAKEAKLEGVAVADGISLASKARDSSYWQFVETKNGYLVTATGGKYKGWAWDFGGGDPSHQESGREVAVNVLLAERVVAGSYFAVNPK